MKRINDRKQRNIAHGLYKYAKRCVKAGDCKWEVKLKRNVRRLLGF